MKNFFKMLMLLITAALFLWAGYFMVLNNLNYLLATEKTSFQCQVKNPGIIIITGKWIEVIDLKLPGRFFRQAGHRVLKTGKEIINEFVKSYLINRVKFPLTQPSAAVVHP